jgi:iron-sulfur cluster assembly protein
MYDAAGSSLALAVVEAPEPADAEIESRGAHVFVAPALGEVLDDKVLHAGFGGGSVRFAPLAP